METQLLPSLQLSEVDPLLTSSEVELMETSLLAVKSSISPLLLTSSEVELMETTKLMISNIRDFTASDFLGS